MSPYISKVNNEAVSTVEAGPAQRNLCGSNDPPALDVKKSLCTKVIGDHMVETWGHTSCLRIENSQTSSIPLFIWALNCFFLSHESLFPKAKCDAATELVEKTAVSKSWLKPQ